MTAVSVVMPTYNRAALLPRAIQSVLSQSLHDLELIIVDDGSTDDTERVIGAIRESDARVRYRRQENRGAAAARNRGIAEAQGMWIAFQDSDDVWHPSFLSSLIALARPNAVVFSSHTLVRRNGASDVVPRGNVQEPSRALLRGNFVSTQATLTPRALFSRFGFDETLPRFQDWDLWLTFIGAGVDFIHVPQSLVTLYRQIDSISEGAHATRGTALRRILTKHRRVLSRDPYAVARLAGRAYAPRRVVTASQRRKGSGAT